jgi:hypothetical protein
MKIISPATAKKRVGKLGSSLGGMWPKDKMQFMTSVSTATLVDAHYRASIPSEGPVKLAVLSESPCFTRDDLVAMKADPTILEEAGMEELAEDLLFHVNLVHCLTYGEAWTIDPTTIPEKSEDKKRQYSNGTPAFWKFLATMAGRVDVDEEGNDPLQSQETIDKAFEPLTRSPKKLCARLKYKIQILKDLKEKGIVLIDVSPFAIYFGSKTVTRYNQKTGKPYYTPAYKLSSKEYNMIISTAFETYSGPFLHDIKPENVLVLGKNVGNVLCNKKNGMLQNLLNGFNGNLLDVLTHPSSNSFWGKNTVSSLQTLRHYSLIARGKIPASTPVPVPIVINEQLVVINKTRKNKRSSPKTGTKRK